MSTHLDTLPGPFDVRSPDRLTFGFGAVAELEAYAEDRSIEDALVVTDGAIRAAGVTEPVEAALRAAGVDVEVYDDVKPEPKLRMAEEAAALAGKDDLVVGIGGGSAMDTAKVAAALAAHDAEVREFVGMGNVPGPTGPLALVPTTAGTGSEVTHIGVFTDSEEGGVKKVVYSEHLFADIAVVDPSLTETMPKGVAAATGLDALTHAVESYVTTLRNPISDGRAREAIELAGKNLRGAVHRGTDAERYGMCLAATLAGQAFVNSGLGAVHALTYPLGIDHGIGHGRANAMLLPHVMEYNVPADPERYADVAEWIGADVDPHAPAIDRAYAGVEAVTRLTADVGIDPGIRNVADLDRDDFERFADIAIEYSQHNIDRNPRSLDREDLIAIYESAYASG